MPWGVAAAAVTAYGQHQQGEANRNAARRAQNSAAFRPFNVQGGAGSAIFDDGTINLALDPRLEQLQSGLFSRAEDQLGALGDPTQIAQDQYGRMMALLNPQQEQARTSLENRLFAQGRLGSTGGSQQFGQLLQSQENAKAGIAADALSQGLATRGTQLNQLQQLFQGGIGLEQSAVNAANMGMVAGGRQSAAGAATADLTFGAYANSPSANVAGGLSNYLSNNPGLFNTQDQQTQGGTAGQNYYSDNYIAPGGSYGNTPSTTDMSIYNEPSAWESM